MSYELPYEREIEDAVDLKSDDGDQRAPIEDFINELENQEEPLRYTPLFNKEQQPIGKPGQVERVDDLGIKSYQKNPSVEIPRSEALVTQHEDKSLNIP